MEIQSTTARKLLIAEIVIGVLILIAMIVVFAYDGKHEDADIVAGTETPTPSIVAGDDDVAVYTNQDLHISLRYPSNWVSTAQGPNHFEGEDGFITIDALQSESSIDSAAEDAANHVLMPYGPSPQIESMIITGQEARLIFPGIDDFGSIKVGQIIVQYPQPIYYLNDNYQFLVLYGDLTNLEDTAKTLKFL